MESGGMWETDRVSGLRRSASTEATRARSSPEERMMNEPDALLHVIRQKILAGRPPKQNWRMTWYGPGTGGSAWRASSPSRTTMWKSRCDLPGGGTIRLHRKCYDVWVKEVALVRCVSETSHGRQRRPREAARGVPHLGTPAHDADATPSSTRQGFEGITINGGRGGRCSICGEIVSSTAEARSSSGPRRTRVHVP